MAALACPRLGRKSLYSCDREPHPGARRLIPGQLWFPLTVAEHGQRPRASESAPTKWHTEASPIAIIFRLVSIELSSRYSGQYEVMEIEPRWLSNLTGAHKFEHASVTTALPSSNISLAEYYSIRSARRVLTWLTRRESTCGAGTRPCIGAVE
jgi:hypothetical protein